MTSGAAEVGGVVDAVLLEVVRNRLTAIADEMELSLLRAAFTTPMCDHQGIGGMVPGSLRPNATDLFQEGLRIPPLKLVDRGQPVEPLFAILRSNVRVPDAVMGDLRAQLAACEVGRRRVVELVEHEGADGFAA